MIKPGQVACELVQFSCPNPSVTIEVHDLRYAATAREVTGEERDRLFAAQSAVMPGFKNYQDAASRVIPVIVLERTN